MKAIVALQGKEAMDIVAILENHNIKVWQFSAADDACEFVRENGDVGMLVIGNSTADEIQDGAKMALALKSHIQLLQVVGISTDPDMWGELVSAGCNYILTLGLSVEEDLRCVAAEVQINMHIAWVA